MNFHIEELTSPFLVRRMARFTAGLPDRDIGIAPKQYKKFILSEHSPIRAHIFLVFMYDIPKSASSHIVRHNVGIVHYVQTSRPDRTGVPRTDGNINHAMILNAQALLAIARKRLCAQAEGPTKLVCEALVEALHDYDQFADILADAMVPECEYRGGICHELKPCGRNPTRDELCPES